MDLVEAIPFLHALADDHSLDHLSPTVQRLEEADVNSGLATLVGAIGRHRGLICLCITARVDEEPQKDILESLGACTCLETLEITIIALFLRIGDNEVGNVLGNMGRLKKLKPDLSTGSMFPLTPQSLVFAVQSRPDLEDATFVVNAMNVIPEAAISFPWIHKKLRNLWMADCNFYPDKISEISSPKAVAAFISQITECEITFSKTKHDDDQAMAAGLWEEVADLVPWFQRVRRIVIMESGWDSWVTERVLMFHEDMNGV
ncbi:hypothetical protein FRB94_000593 [Tulasnella sp. JGI-2019a]|nr:hypothetical protein FRB93_013723 [Tulasnella sp. JGI-2019a]KAG9006576.1 hypothetical protein FRB94_000593 [Tulasnella sp. JGI-2019a]